MRMYLRESRIETALDVIDELADVRMALNGLASLSLALANSGMHEPDAIRLVSRLLDHCALILDDVQKSIPKVE